MINLVSCDFCMQLQYLQRQDVEEELEVMLSGRDIESGYAFIQ